MTTTITSLMKDAYLTIINKIKQHETISAKDWQFIKSYEKLLKSEEKQCK